MAGHRLKRNLPAPGVERHHSVCESDKSRSVAETKSSRTAETKSSMKSLTYIYIPGIHRRACGTERAVQIVMYNVYIYIEVSPVQCSFCILLITKLPPPPLPMSLVHTDFSAHTFCLLLTNVPQGKSNKMESLDQKIKDLQMENADFKKQVFH